ncbi:MAG: hypothetical protein KJZ84_24325 [Bryobacteraceae bacterium]|nr:hypothetical protein [Bryobacteraceae bacterium]
MEDLSRFLDLAYSGRAVLLAGQDLEPGTTERLSHALAKATGVQHEMPLGQRCATLSDPAPLVAAAKYVMNVGATSGMRLVAEVPWAAVFTAAIDDTLSAELGRQDSEGRRLRHLAVDERMPAFFPRQNDILTVLHLLHIADSQSPTGLPVYGRHWTRAQKLLIPGVLRAMPEAIGPAHVLCIAGVSTRGHISNDIVAAMAADLDPDNVYWFIAPSDGISVDEVRAIAPHIHLIESDLPTALAAREGKRAALLESKHKVLETDDLAISVAVGDIRRVLTFRAAELREFRRHLSILPDLADTAPPTDLSRRKHAFVNFLSRSRQTPDWEGIAEGYAFERDAYRDLLGIVLERLDVIAGSASRSHMPRGQGGPIILSGPPAAGRSVGLLWLGYHLRRRGVFSVQLLPSGGTVDHGAVEQIIRLAEGRGATATVVLLDRTDRRVADNLDRHLRSAGRRTIVVAASAPTMRRQPGRALDDMDEEEPHRGTEITLEHRLAETEILGFRHYLEANSPSTSSDVILSLLAQDPTVFALLYRLIPDTRENIRSVLIDEYMQLAENLASFRPPTLEAVRGSTLSDQLRAWVSTLDRPLPKNAHNAVHPPAPPHDPWYNIATQLPRLVLLFSRLDEAITLSLLTKRFPGLLKVYSTLRGALESSGLFVEVVLDKQNDIGLTAVNPFIAQLLLDAAVPSSVERLQILATLLYEFPWDPDRRPIDAPEQALLLHTIRSISPPSGPFQAEFQRTEDLRSLADILRTLRESYGATLPQLILTEGIVLRHLGRRLGDTERPHEAREYYRLSRRVLELAREILARRKPSPARNFEMSMVLNAIATTIGHSFTAESRMEQVDEAECKKLLESALTTASESRAYTDAYHPLDTAFWTNRDFLNYLSTRPATADNEAERQNALLSMADALDKAGELGDLPTDQADRLSGRLVELDARLNNVEQASARAESEASQGRFSGVCILARFRAIDNKNNSMIGPQQAKAALSYLETFAPRILNDDRALTLMHRLWIGGHLGNRRMDEGPHAIGCSTEEWRQLERIASARRTLGGNTRVPYVNFWFAVALAHQGDIRRALQMLEEVQANSLAFSHRRLTPLVYLANEDGSAKEFGTIVRRRDEDDLITMFVPAISIEVRLSKRYQGQTLMNLQRADEARVLIALNYWNPMAVDPQWEKGRLQRMDTSKPKIH